MGGISFVGTVLKVSRGSESKEFDLLYEIGDVLCRDEKIFVRFKAVGDKTPERNIICLGMWGQKLWQAQDPDDWRTGKVYANKDIYVGMNFDEEGHFWVAGGQSKYHIDVDSGKILEEVFTK